jgi:hypothetical protein
MEKEVMSKHLRTERIDRAEYIATTIGIGKEVIRKEKKGRDSYSCLTDTGVVIIRGFDNSIITMYIATMAQATAIAEGNLPKYLKDVVRRNEKKNYQKNQNGG